jgi:antitoxin component YwqK of YwqJK toxin-antitoxin module
MKSKIHENQKTIKIMSKKFLLIVAVMVSGLVFSQESAPVLEAEGQLVKATYFYENGNVQQVGYFKDGKLDGKWTSYEANGNVKAIAEYSNGTKTGKWMYFSNSVCTNEVDYSDNRIVAIKNLNQNPVAVKN